MASCPPWGGRCASPLPRVAVRSPRDALTALAATGVQPGDLILVGAAGAIVVGAGLLSRSLGDVMGAEAQLPPASGAKSRRETKRSARFLPKNPGKGKGGKK
ncbi:hypothetical protein MMPV_006716 [Pyropia vietnamensis]